MTCISYLLYKLEIPLGYKVAQLGSASLTSSFDTLSLLLVKFSIKQFYLKCLNFYAHSKIIFNCKCFNYIKVHHNNS